MKKILTSLIAVSMVATPAMADGYRGPRGGDYHERHEESHGSGCGWLCGAIIGGVVLSAIGSSRENRREDNRYYPPNSRYDERYCVREQVVEWHHGERYIFWQTTCN
jgi:hypothetical protein